MDKLAAARQSYCRGVVNLLAYWQVAPTLARLTAAHGWAWAGAPQHVDALLEHPAPPPWRPANVLPVHCGRVTLRRLWGEKMQASWTGSYWLDERECRLPVFWGDSWRDLPRRLQPARTLKDVQEYGKKR